MPAEVQQREDDMVARRSLLAALIVGLRARSGQEG